MRNTESETTGITQFGKDAFLRGRLYASVPNPIFPFCSHYKCDSVESILAPKFLYFIKHLLNVDKATDMNRL